MTSLVNKTFLSRPRPRARLSVPRPRPRPRLFSQDKTRLFVEARNQLHAIRNIPQYECSNITKSQIYTQSPVLITFCPLTMSKHSNHHVTGIIMSPLLTVICRLPISPLTSLSLQTLVSSVTFCKHQVTQQLVIHPGSVRPDEQNSVSE